MNFLTRLRKAFFSPVVVEPVVQQAELLVPLTKPWRRKTFRENMEPLSKYNFHSSWCAYCGDWIEDRAFYHEHDGGHKHKPLKGSWNYEMPHMTRRDPDEIQPTHEEWLDEMREWAAKSNGMLCSSANEPNPHARTNFRSQEEADLVLNPFGLQLAYHPNAGWEGRGGWQIDRIRQESEHDSTTDIRSA